MFYEGPEEVSRTGPTGPRIPLRRSLGPTGPKIPPGTQSGEGTLSIGGGLVLMFVGVIVDAAGLFLDFIYIGFVLNPLLLTPLAWLIFGVVLHHNGVSMLSGKRAVAGWLTLVAEFAPGLGALLPGWFAYALFLTAAPRVAALVRSIMS
ncbi:hypothetical protein A3D71_03295 [Candidatus Kaiserbacteria bacterium RIFCSPHIGHO2_02_FULL_55_20]|uniref:Uncharacterized protein n=1 Tax=Candidatus Kaiserbacteria bacterium RIFCSPHIGHO2_02_FULL_55_20 TaxID=1798497 RepID=A0A1F6DXB8_9BACT|nr:MAG: hypothetical protein A2680_02290 [Candidatus Kaiserbacteria bacterium RIFCSPHIGHO2_01_FULL_55_37]OGG66058.1 MAG: hypothetical protein A3D71_03295 [Candidatus Kaiserbacteria bacterium RIFCSPHIGHO2_02_FULL_55_20]